MAMITPPANIADTIQMIRVHRSQSLPLKNQYGGPILDMLAVFQSAGSLCQPESRSERNRGRKPEEDDGEQT